MFTAIKISIALAAIILGAQLFLPVVTELPFGMDEAVQFFFATIRALMDVIPWITVPFSLMVLALFIKGLFLLWHFVRWVLGFLK